MSKENGLALLARLHSTKRKGTTANSLRRHRHNSASVANGDDLFQMPLEENTDFLYYQSREITMDSAEYLCLNGLLNMPHSCDEDHGLASGNSKTSPNQQQKHVQEKSLHLPLPCPSPDGRAYHDSEASTPVTRSTKGLSFDVDRIVDDRLRSRRRRASSRSSSRRGPAPRRGRRDGAPVQREQTEAGSDGVSHERDEPAGARKPSSKTSLKSRGRPQRDRAARPRGAISPDRAGARDGQRLRRCWRGAGETGEKEARVGREKLKGAGGKEWARGRKVGARCETCERGAKLARRECAPPHCAARS